jgi:hypothetical protein
MAASTHTAPQERQGSYFGSKTNYDTGRILSDSNIDCTAPVLGGSVQLTFNTLVHPYIEKHNNLLVAEKIGEILQ